MAEKETPVEGSAPPTHDVRELVIGVLDVMMALGATLANRGLLTREEIADLMGRMRDHLERSGEDHPSRLFPLETMERLFSAPVMQGGRGPASLVPIKGGKQ
jgi:hypothetical protein